MTTEFEFSKKEEMTQLRPTRISILFEGWGSLVFCAARWEEARMAGKAPKVVLEATNIKCLDICDLEHLKKHTGGH